MSGGTPQDWLVWLTNSDPLQVQEARLALGGTQPGQGVPLQPLVTGVHDSNAEVALWSLVAIAGLGTEAALAVRLAGGLDRRAIRERALARFSVARMVDAYERVYRDLVEAALRDERVPAERVAEAVAVASSADGHGPATGSGIGVTRSRIPVGMNGAVARDRSGTGG